MSLASNNKNEDENHNEISFQIYRGTRTRVSLVCQKVKKLPAMQQIRVRSLGQEDPLGEGNGSPLQYSCLENPMDGGAW